MRCRVEWDFWTSANDGCGNACDRQASFKVAMRETAQTLEKVTGFFCDCLVGKHQCACQQPFPLHSLARPSLLTEPSQLMMADQDICCHCVFSMIERQRAGVVPLQHEERPKATTSAKGELRWGAMLQDKFSLFTPHFMLRKCSYDTDSTECTTNCIHKGRYCAVDSIDDDYSRKFQGWQVRLAVIS